ncbi:hypothetical protein Tco_1207206, partial [Tanacetum coccineum]
MVNASRTKKLEKYHNPLALVAHTGSSSRQTSSYYVTHLMSVVDYDDEYQQDDVHNNFEDEQENFAWMAYSYSGSDTEVTSCLKECEESYAKLKKLYDEQREQLGDASIEIKAYTLALAKVEAQLVCHQKNQLAYEEEIRFMKIAVKGKEELKTKLEKWQNSSKSLNKLLDSQMSV